MTFAARLPVLPSVLPRIRPALEGELPLSQLGEEAANLLRLTA
jgi:hypothetical protein